MTDEKINYTSFLQGKQQEINPLRLARMKDAVVKALKVNDVHGHISCTYYTDGNALVQVNGEYYGVINCNTGNFFSGFVGD